MVYLRDQGFPVPAIEELTDDGADLIMERIDGPSMVDALARQPWTIRRQARMLAELHIELHEIAPPDFLRADRWAWASGSCTWICTPST